MGEIDRVAIVRASRDLTAAVVSCSFFTLVNLGLRRKTATAAGPIVDDPALTVALSLVFIADMDSPRGGITRVEPPDRAGFYNRWRHSTLVKATCYRVLPTAVDELNPPNLSASLE